MWPVGFGGDMTHFNNFDIVRNVWSGIFVVKSEAGVGELSTVNALAIIKGGTFARVDVDFIEVALQGMLLVGSDDDALGLLVEA